MTELVAYRHLGCGKPVHVEVEPGYERNEWVLICACGEYVSPDGHSLEAVAVDVRRGA